MERVPEGPTTPRSLPTLGQLIRIVALFAPALAFRLVKWLEQGRITPRRAYRVAARFIAFKRSNLAYTMCFCPEHWDASMRAYGLL